MLEILNQTFKRILEATYDRLRPLGYVKRGNTFRHIAEGNCGLVDFQRSVKSGSDILVFTINLGVVVDRLLDSRAPEINKAAITDAHLRQRIGKFVPDCPDKWWEVTPSADSLSLINELLPVLLNYGVPFVESHLSTEALVALWKSGPSPGLTMGQRDHFLAKLEC